MSAPTLKEFRAGMDRERERRQRVAEEKLREKRRIEDRRKAVECDVRSFICSRTEKYYWKSRRQNGRWTKW